MSNLVLNNINKVFKNGFYAVKNVNLNIEPHEFLVLVGPSGCGKTTILRMIAGLEEMTSGTINIDGKIVNDVEAKDRDIAMVFQNYALYPHMTVFENMAFGLKMRRVDKKEIRAKVESASKALGIFDLLERRPHQLSGGQRQRVALGRAIVRNPKIFLMDEPLSNLDAKLRVEMRAEIISLFQDRNATFVYVTHDQTEAMTMGTRIVVMNEGEIQQEGTPKEIYESPVNTFVASFIGNNKMNFINAEVIEKDDSLYFSFQGFKLKPSEDALQKLYYFGYKGKEVLLGIRPEHILVANDKSLADITLKVKIIEFLGSEKIIHFHFSKESIMAKITSDINISLGDEMGLCFLPHKLHIFDKDTKEAICYRRKGSDICEY